MDHKVIINQLKLAYSPLSNYDFTMLRKDADVHAAIQHSSLYAICQRPELRFDNVLPDLKNNTVSFEIRQRKNDQFLKCRMSIQQENISDDPAQDILMVAGSDNPAQDILMVAGSYDPSFDNSSFPANNVHGIKFFIDEETPESFLLWLSPEKFLQNYWSGAIEAEVEGDIHALTKYKVHYVGEATKQDIWKRLTGHEKLQDILSLENPLNYGSLPTHEIAILLFELHDNLEMKTFGLDADPDEIANSLMGLDRPDLSVIFLDAEKALINAMQPKYNEKLFKNYPKSKDGLYKFNYDHVSYSFMDPLTLLYDNGEIEGRQEYLGGDTIAVAKGKTPVLLKYRAHS